MNRINPAKLLNSKWTAREPQLQERHFIVTRLIRNEDEKIVACDLEAVISRNIYPVEWQQLRDSSKWITGWK
jgi:tryptophan-rich hypothetical protein